MISLATLGLIVSLAAAEPPPGKPVPGAGAPDAAAPRRKLSLDAPDVLVNSDSTAERSYTLEKQKDGGYLHRAQQFEARVDPDGQVHFRDHRVNLERVQVGPVVLKRSAATGNWAVDSLLGGLKEQSLHERSPYRPIEQPSDRASGLNRLPPVTLLISATARFDLVDEFTRFVSGKSPYRYEQARFLAATFELRTKMAAQARAQLLRRSIAQLPGRLDALWSDAGYTPREKRRVIYLLWSEVDNVDPETAPAATAVEAWIRRRLPPGSPDAYSPAELQTFRTQTQGRVFAPYLPASTDGERPAAADE